jgi:hypothetical protein
MDAPAAGDACNKDSHIEILISGATIAQLVEADVNSSARMRQPARNKKGAQAARLWDEVSTGSA